MPLYNGSEASSRREVHADMLSEDGSSAIANIALYQKAMHLPQGRYKPLILGVSLLLPDGFTIFLLLAVERCLGQQNSIGLYAALHVDT